RSHRLDHGGRARRLVHRSDGGAAWSRAQAGAQVTRLPGSSGPHRPRRAGGLCARHQLQQREEPFMSSGIQIRQPTAMLRVEEARAILAECRSVDEAKTIRDKAEAIRAYLTTQKASRDAQNVAAEI